LLDHARRYWSNAREIGEPGHIDMQAGGSMQAQHALMAQTAALISIAESLDSIATTNRISARRGQLASKALDTLAKELTKIRYMVPK
jgi:hypothetical protein